MRVLLNAGANLSSAAPEDLVDVRAERSRGQLALIAYCYKT